MLPLQELERLGIKIALYPSSSLRVAVRTLGRFYADLKAEGDSSVWLDRMATLDETNEVLGLPAIMEFERGVLAKTGQP